MSFVFNPIDPEFLRDPYPTYEVLRHEHPVYRHPAGFWVLSRYGDVLAALKNAEVFSSAAMGGQQGGMAGTQRPQVTIGQSLISRDPPVHTEQRNVVNRGFTPARVKAMAPRIQAIADELFASFESDGRVDLTAALANPLPVSVIAELLGLDASRRDEFKELSTDIIIGTTQGQMAGNGEKILDSMERFQACIVEAIEDRKSHPGADLISILVDAQVGEGILDADSTIGFAGLLLAAGSETTTNLIGNAMLSLLEDPGLRKRVAEDSALLEPLVEESLRHDPPVQLLMRLTTRDIEIEGVTIPAGNLVMAALGSANRDETRFADPDVFDLDRNTAGHVAFGFGNHFCLGASLARLEGTIALGNILERLPNPRHTAPEVEYHGSFLIRGPTRLPIEFDARQA
jgi:cytochrome P450